MMIPIRRCVLVISAVLALWAGGGCASRRAVVPVPVPPGSAKPTQGHELEGLASWYDAGTGSGVTASGERYNPNDFTAAHRTLPFGTVVRVENTRNGRQVIVRINDRGPFKPGRVIDLSRAAAERLDMLRDGLAPVRLTRLN